MFVTYYFSNHHLLYILVLLTAPHSILWLLVLAIDHVVKPVDIRAVISTVISEEGVARVLA